MKNLQRGLMLPIFLLLGGCEDLLETNIESQFPVDLTGYQIVIYNTDIDVNPDNLNISDRTVYWFQNATSVYGEGTDNSGPLPVDSWNWNYDPADATSSFDVAGVSLDYGSSGREHYTLFWHYREKDLEKRQTFAYNGNLGNFAAVRTTGYYELVKR